MANKLFILSVLLGSMVIGKTQPYIDVFKFQYYNYGNNTYSENDDKLSSHELWADVALPIEVKKLGYLYTGATYSSIQLNNDSVSPVSLNSLLLSLGLIHTWKNDKWSTMFLLMPRINSDFKKISSEHWQLTNVCVNYFKANNKLTWAFGYFFNTEFYGPLVLPLFGVEWKITNKLQIFSLLPDNFNVEYKVSDRLYTGLAYRIYLASYRLSEDNDSYYVVEGDIFWGHHQAKAFVDFYVLKNVVFSVDVGRTFIRDYAKYDKDDKLIESDPLFTKFDNDFYVKLGLAYRFRFDTDEESK